MADALARMRERRAARVRAALPTRRECGSCDLCCTAPGIKEMGKPPGVACKHLCGTPGASCAVYASRPKVCIDFHCLWRMADHVLPAWMHPAECGFMLAFNNPAVWPSVVTVHVDPARPEAWRNPWAMTMFATLAETWNCLVAIGQVPLCTHIFCPDGSLISAELNPTLFNRENGTVGAPTYVFGPDRRPVVERLRETSFEWNIPPPPRAARE